MFVVLWCISASRLSFSHFDLISSRPIVPMATSPDDETDPMSNRYIPREARAVPHEETVHTIEFRKITYPLTDRPAELWIVETNHQGHTHWRTLERFLHDFAISPLGAPSGLRHGQLRSPGNTRPSVARILQCS